MEDQTRNFCNGLNEGVVNVLTQSLVVFQGQVVNDNGGHRKSYIPPQSNVANQGFIFLELRCEPAFIRENANLETINPPLFEQGDIIKIRLAEIVAIGPGTGCPVPLED